MRYDKIIEYANSKSLVVSEAPNSGLKMNYEVGDVHINLFVQPKPNLPQPLIKCVGKINLGRRDNLVVFNEFNILFKNEAEAIEFLKVIVVCANYVKIGADKLNESIEEVAL